MKILATGDWHADAYTAGVRRFEDIANAAHQTVRRCNDASCSLYLFLGDLTDPEVGAFQANHLALKIAGSLPSTMSSRWLVGNHDVIESSYGEHAMLPLAARHKVIDQPTSEVFFPETDCSVGVVYFPYTSTARSYDPEAFADKAAAKLNGKAARVLVASHLMIEGITPGSETTDMARGRDVFLPVKKLYSLFGDTMTIVQGHYHQSQTFPFPVGGDSTVAIHIPGSLVRLTKGEIGNIPGYLLLDV